MKVSDLLAASLAELNIYQAGEALSGEDADLALLILNEILDAWNVDEHALFSSMYVNFTLTPGLAPHTIGLAANSPTFVVTTNRPIRILGANLILTTSTPNIYKPLTLRDDDWWLNQRVPTLSGSIPTDLFYSPDWPNGALNFWPVPTVAYGVQLETDTVLAQVALTTTFSLPPGYQQALRLTHAEACVSAFGVPMPPTLPSRALEARGRVFGNNTDIPRLQTATAGLSGGGGRTVFDYRTGRVT